MEIDKAPDILPANRKVLAAWEKLLPESIRLCLADPLSGGDWRAPERLPTSTELFDAIAHLEARLIPAVVDDVAVCLKAMVNVLGTQTLSEDEHADRARLFMGAVSHLPPDLLELATARSIRAFEFVPSPAQFLQQVEKEHDQRLRMLNRAKVLDSFVKQGKKPPAPFVREPEDQRLRATIWLGWKHRESFNGMRLFESARAAERKLAIMEQRPPADWAVDQVDALAVVEAVAPVTFSEPPPVSHNPTPKEETIPW